MGNHKTLRQKALTVAVDDIKRCITPAAANIVFTKWKVFHNDRTFKQAIKDKQAKFIEHGKFQHKQRRKNSEIGN